MDDQAALIARRVAMAADAWFHAPRDVEAYRRLAEVVDAWRSYGAPSMPIGVDPGGDRDHDELLDELADRVRLMPDRISCAHGYADDVGG